MPTATSESIGALSATPFGQLPRALRDHNAGRTRSSRHARRASVACSRRQKSGSYPSRSRRSECWAHPPIGSNECADFRVAHGSLPGDYRNSVIPYHRSERAPYSRSRTSHPLPRQRDRGFDYISPADWSKAPFPGQYIFEYYRRLAEADEQRRKPQPTKTVFAKGCMEWFAEQKNSG